MRKVFANHSEVCHVWASRTQQTGRAGNISFNGNTILSYHWWPMATFRDDLKKIDGQPVVVVRWCFYSSSTSTHQRHVANAIPRNNYAILNTNLDPSSSKKDMIKDWFRVVRTEIIRMSKARTRYQRGYEAKNAISCLLKTMTTKRDKAKLRDLLDQMVQIEAEGKAKQAKRWIKKAKAYYLKFVNSPIPSVATPENIAHMRSRAKGLDEMSAKSGLAFGEDVTAHRSRLYTVIAKYNDQLMIRWRNGEKVHLSYEIPVMLRLYNETVETSKGAYVPLAQASYLYRCIKAGKDVIGQRIGHYTVNAVNGTLRIGCHNIAMDEVERFAAKMNW